MKKKAVPLVAERKPEKEIEEPPTGPATPEDQESIDEEGEIAEEPKVEPQKLISIKEIFAGVDPKKIKMAEGLGIPLQPLMNYMWQQEQITMALLQSNEKLTKGLEPLMTAIQKAPAPNSGNPAQGNSGLGGLMQFLPQILGSGSQNPMMDKLQETFMDAGLRSMTLTSRIGETVLSKVTTELSAKAVQGVVDAATK